MKIFTDEEVLVLFKNKVKLKTLQTWARAGKIPAFKVGTNWMFFEQDLLEWIRSHYNQDAMLKGVNKKRSDVWHLKDAEKKESIQLNYKDREKEYDKALGRQTTKKLSDCMTK